VVKYVTFSNLIIDDIVLSDGRTFMNKLGGAGTHALVGMRVWSDQLGYVATIGPDFEPALRETLTRFGVDLEGCVEREGYRTARAWQLFEPDERRIEIFRTDLEEFRRCQPTFDDLPASYLQARGFHLQWGTLEELGEAVEALREANPQVCLVWEPSPPHLDQPRAQFERVLQQVDLFSPDFGEAAEITGESTPEAAIDTLLEWGTPLVALRQGARGSIVRTALGEGWRVPAVPATIVDVTGAGNSYCGGFLAGLGEGLEPLEAALRATVSAGFALEQFGLPAWDETMPQERDRRLEWARERVEPLATVREV
jgi:sugar/nucleoside kinase (ribokinase family)